MPAVARKRRKRDPNMPKRPANAFMQFSLARRDGIKEANPGMPKADVGKMLAEQWKAMSKQDKQVGSFMKLVISFP
jgi:hypothetical protein